MKFSIGCATVDPQTPEYDPSPLKARHLLRSLYLFHFSILHLIPPFVCVKNVLVLFWLFLFCFFVFSFFPSSEILCEFGCAILLREPRHFGAGGGVYAGGQRWERVDLQLLLAHETRHFVHVYEARGI